MSKIDGLRARMRREHDAYAECACSHCRSGNGAKMLLCKRYATFEAAFDDLSETDPALGLQIKIARKRLMAKVA